MQLLTDQAWEQQAASKDRVEHLHNLMHGATQATGSLNINLLRRNTVTVTCANGCYASLQTLPRQLY